MKDLENIPALMTDIGTRAKAAAQQKMSVAEIHFDERVRRNSPDENPNELRERIALYVSWCKYCQARSRIRSRWAAIWYALTFGFACNAKPQPAPAHPLRCLTICRHNFNFILWVITVAAAVGTRKEYPALLSRFLTIARKLSPLATLALAAVATVDTMYNSSATAHHSVMKRAKLLGLELKYLNAKEVFRGADRDTCDDFEMRRRELEEDFDK